MEVGLSPCDFVLDGDPDTFTRGGGWAEPLLQFSAHFYCGQMAACIKMPLGMELRLSRGNIVLDGDPVAPSPKGGGPPNIRPMFIVTKRLDG